LETIGYLVLVIWCLSSATGLGGFGDEPGAKASGTDLHMNGPSRFEGLNFMEVWVPDFSSLVIGVTYIMSKDRPLPADTTDFCHN
jgi:hypothetical protein